MNAIAVRRLTWIRLAVVVALALAAFAGLVVGPSAAPSRNGDEPTAYITFCINVHDFFHVDESADILLRLVDLFERHGVRGDFYLTSPMVHCYGETRPDVIARLRDSDMTISYHVRPPHPTYRGFDGRLEELHPDELAATLLAYETTRLDLATGNLIAGEPGGMRYLTEVFGRPPTVGSVPFERWRPALLPIWHDLGARMTVTYHETGTDPEDPFVWRDGLLIRPSDFSITRWSADPGPEDQFWWNMLDTPLADRYVPADHLRQELATWDHDRPPFVTVLIHENNFTRRHATPWAHVYYEETRKATPREPPFDLEAPDASDPRTADNAAAIWSAYEDLVAFAAEHLRVVTSEDIVRMAEEET